MAGSRAPPRIREGRHYRLPRTEQRRDAHGERKTRLSKIEREPLQQDELRRDEASPIAIDVSVPGGTARCRLGELGVERQDGEADPSARARRSAEKRIRSRTAERRDR